MVRTGVTDIKIGGSQTGVACNMARTQQKKFVEEVMFELRLYLSRKGRTASQGGEIICEKVEE